MKKIILGIHGLGNKPPEKVLKKWWEKAIREGLKNAGYPQLFFKFELAYWAQYLHPQPLSPKERDKKSPFYIDSPYLPNSATVAGPPNKFRQKIFSILEKEMDKIFLKKDMSINFEAIPDLIIRKFFRDLDIYYSADYRDNDDMMFHVKEAIRNRLAKFLNRHEDKEILLIAHSMGSIIAYDVLARSLSDVPIHTLVTLGSPLGMPIVMGKFVKEENLPFMTGNKLRTPESVRKYWYNLSDLNDKVAMNHDLSDDYDENSSHVHVIDRIVYNNYEYDGKGNPHQAYGYLRTPEMAEIVYNFLTEGRNRFTLWLDQRFATLKAAVGELF